MEVLEVTDIRQSKVPKHISNIEAAEYQRKGRDIFASVMEGAVVELKKNTKEVSFTNFVQAATRNNVNW